MSISITQSARQHRFRHAATAPSADLPGREPQESGWNTGSTCGSRYSRATVWATRSATVGTPSKRTPLPPAFGISTAFARRALVGLDPFVCFPDLPLGDLKRLVLLLRLVHPTPPGIAG